MVPQLTLSMSAPKIVLEALHNCIAHQDYMRNGRINVIEKPEKLIFENEGSFYEGLPDDYVLGEKCRVDIAIPSLYRQWSNWA